MNTPAESESKIEGLSGFLWALAIGPAIMLVWLIGMAVASLTIEPTDTVMIIGPQKRAFSAVAGTQTQILTAGEGFVVVRGTRKGYVRRLYRNGALLVLPTAESMCGHPGVVRKIVSGY